MNRKRFGIWALLLLAVAVGIHFFSLNEPAVEKYYSSGLYPRLALFFRYLTGWLPFSFGDLLYLAAALWILWKTGKAIRALYRRKVTRQSVYAGLRKGLLIVLGLYIIFNLFWGINYNRQGIYPQVGVVPDTFSYEEIKEVSFLLADKLNAGKNYLAGNRVTYPSNKELFKEVAAAYDKVNKVYPFLEYKAVSVKPSMWGWMGNYTGFTGYYNPFTGEAQLNTLVPEFLQPFVACHEVAHQLGYAKENEASAVGYLAALHSGDSLLLYSTYFELFNAAKRELIVRSYSRGDTTMRKQLSDRLLPAVKDDIREVAIFFNRHRNPVEPFVRQGYALYLKRNNQPSGLGSYDEVVGFLVAYYRKFKTI